MYDVRRYESYAACARDTCSGTRLRRGTRDARDTCGGTLPRDAAAPRDLAFHKNGTRNAVRKRRYNSLYIAMEDDMNAPQSSLCPTLSLRGLKLVVTGYEFPDATCPYEANWLMVEASDTTTSAYRSSPLRPFAIITHVARRSSGGTSPTTSL
jgi:hypothetical protein